MTVRSCLTPAGPVLPGALVEIVGPSPSTSIAFSGLTNGSGQVVASLANGSYTYSISKAPQYTTLTGSFTHSGAIFTNHALLAGSTYVCNCHCTVPMPKTLLLTNDFGSVTLNWNASNFHYYGCQTVTVVNAVLTTPTGPCTTGGYCPTTTGADVTFHWWYTCGSCYPHGTATCSGTDLYCHAFASDLCKYLANPSPVTCGDRVVFCDYPCTDPFPCAPTSSGSGPCVSVAEGLFSPDRGLFWGHIPVTGVNCAAGEYGEWTSNQCSALNDHQNIDFGTILITDV